MSHGRRPQVYKFATLSGWVPTLRYFKPHKMAEIKQPKTLRDDKSLSEHSGYDHGPTMKTTSSSSEAALPSELISAGSQQLHRKLGGKEIQLFAIGGAIGTCT